MFRVSELLKATGGRLLRGQLNASVEGVSTDSRTIKKGNLFIAIKGERFNGTAFIEEALRKGAKAVVLERPIKLKRKVPLILVKDSQRALGDIANLHRRRFSIPLIAISGSNGKTTTKEMIAYLLQSKYRVLKNLGTQNNHIGVPLTLLKLNRGHQIAVLELGTNHLGEIKRLTEISRPNLGVLLNIGPSHLEFLKDLNLVYREKYELIKGLINPKVSFLNRDDPFLRRCLAQEKNNFAFSFGLRYRSDFFAKRLSCRGDRLCFDLKGHKLSINTWGSFNIYNALAAIGVARLFGLSYPAIKRQLGKFKFPAGRLGITKLRQTTFIDDSYNANPASLKEAVKVLKDSPCRGRKIIVLGDMLELGKRAGHFHYQAGKQICKICDIIISVGNLSKLAAQAAQRQARAGLKIFNCASSQEARQILFDQVGLQAKDIVLLKGSRRMKLEEIIR